MGLLYSRAEKSHRPGWWNSHEPPTPFAQQEPAPLLAWVRRRQSRFGEPQGQSGSPESLSLLQAAFDILLFLDIIVAYNSVSGSFDGRTFQNSGTSAADKVNDVIVGLLREGVGHIFQRANLPVVDVVHDLKSQIREVSVHRIR